MSCNLTLGRLEPCKDSVGGYKAMYFINFDSAIVSKFTLTAEEVTALSAPVTTYKYELKGANSFDEINENSRENGTSFWAGSGTFVFKKQSLATQKELKILSYGRPQIILEGNDGNFRMIGVDNGCECTVSTSGGAAMGDLNGYNITVTTQENDMATWIAAAQMNNAAGFVVTVGS